MTDEIKQEDKELESEEKVEKDSTAKQKKLAHLITENALKQHPRPLGKLILEAGYGPGMASSPNKLVQSDGVQKELKDFIESLEVERNRAIGLLQKRVKRADYKDLVNAIDKFTRNIQLLSGRATANFRFDIDEETRKKIDKALGRF